MSIFAELERGVVAGSAEELRAIGRRLADELPTGAVTLGLVGPLGAGKTTLAQGIGEGLGVPGVTSPSYNLLHVETTGSRPFAHVDAWRLERPEDYDGLLIDDTVPTGAVLVVEWADRVAAALPEDTLWLMLEPTLEGGRRLRLGVGG
jgi:tRNA threonylcarbamoyladenosine biosynthesis protein TsaE